ncbi:hypothetical protein B0H16DRAFT_1474469 [Mycena metata]|uniref:Uncharacterized protein n=1 Tax=Mycena metata TaxID=1033252 RepID=A0AAD7MJN1_9AGAR|nr:hypothetical protein B0H16DRAFT_1474469 [Mycena metata]
MDRSTEADDSEVLVHSLVPDEFIIALAKCAGDGPGPKRIENWQWHRLETDENSGGPAPMEGVAVDNECGKLKGKRVSGGEHSGLWRTDQYFCGNFNLKLWSGSNEFIGEYPKIEWEPKKRDGCETVEGDVRSMWLLGAARLDDKIGSELLKSGRLPTDLVLFCLSSGVHMCLLEGSMGGRDGKIFAVGLILPSGWFTFDQWERGLRIPPDFRPNPRHTLALGPFCPRATTRATMRTQPTGTKIFT